MSHQNTKSYILCTTPRSGSTLLCSLLQSTGVAGYPESYFRKQDINMWAKSWGVASQFDREYVSAVLPAGMSSNGVFGVRLMWGTLHELLTELRTYYIQESEIGLLTEAFGPTQFVYLRRQDVVAQAVSRAKAEQSDTWHVHSDQSHMLNDGDFTYDYDQIHSYVAETEADNQAWEKWFREHAIEPHVVVYEELSEQREETVASILEFLGVDSTQADNIRSSTTKMADELSQTWIDQYRGGKRG